MSDKYKNTDEPDVLDFRECVEEEQTEECEENKTDCVENRDVDTVESENDNWEKDKEESEEREDSDDSENSDDSEDSEEYEEICLPADGRRAKQER